MRAASGSAPRTVSWPWLVAALCMVAMIWGNSLVPGEGSSGMSLAVADAVQAALRSVGLPWEWVTNFLVRKAAHFTEYAVLGALASQAGDPAGSRARNRYLAIAAALVLVPCVDESIQLLVPGRSGQVSDVLLDCCGALTGSLLRLAAVARARSRRDRAS